MRGPAEPGQPDTVLDTRNLDTRNLDTRNLDTRNLDTRNLDTRNLDKPCHCLGFSLDVTLLCTRFCRELHNQRLVYV